MISLFSSSHTYPLGLYLCSKETSLNTQLGVVYLRISASRMGSKGL